jgi:hypothetical protein
MSAIVGHYRPDGSLKAVALDGRGMDRATMDGVCDWIRQHSLDPGLVPLQCEIGYDEAVDEWRFPVHVRGTRGGIQIDMASQEPAVRTVRRRRVPFPAGPQDVPQ